jgi:hypothetical protein
MSSLTVWLKETIKKNISPKNWPLIIEFTTGRILIIHYVAQRMIKFYNRISPRIQNEIQNYFSVWIRGLGVDDWWKKNRDRKSPDTFPLNEISIISSQKNCALISGNNILKIRYIKQTHKDNKNEKNNTQLSLKYYLFHWQ